jgi:hypothetical protein
MWEKVVYDSACLLTLVGLKTNLSNDNLCGQWMVLTTTKWIGNWILVLKWDWFLSNVMFLIIGSIGVQSSWILFV